MSPLSLCTRYSNIKWLQSIIVIEYIHAKKDTVTTWMMEPAQSEMNILSNGKSHDLGDDMGMPMKTMLDEDQWVFNLYFKWLPFDA